MDETLKVIDNKIDNKIDANQIIAGVPEKLFRKILHGDEHGHAIIDMDDKDEFIAAGWLFCGTVSEDLVIYARVRRP